MRLDKILAHLGYGSRKEVKKIIRAGLVLVNGEVVRDDDIHVDPDEDEIIVGEEEESIAYSHKVYWILNKPQDVVSATTDSRYPTVISLMPQGASHGVFPIGRLDIDTEGLLILSNDGALAHNLLSPKKHVEKEYEVELLKDWDDRFESALNKGILIKEPDFLCKPAFVKVLGSNRIRLVITEGKFHQVKRMMAACNNEVTHLKRVRMGMLELDPTLEPGQCRPMTPLELQQLQKTHD
jgi:16S rRNA pseudouridine516 synthase